MDDVFRALADPSRRQLLDSLNGRNGQTLSELCSGLEMARQSVSKHLAILEAANLVTTVRRGREKLHYLNPAPIHEIGQRWITRYEQARVDALGDLKRALEEESAVSRPTFVYTTYIRTTPEQLWEALTSPAFTSRYWGATFDTDWQPGSTMRWELRGVTIDDPEQVVVEADPPRRLSYRWHTLTPELADVLDLTDEAHERIVAERRSTVTFDLEPLDGLVKLTVVHDGFDEGSVMAQLVTGGWPSVLSNLKTLLETGETLPPSAEPPAAARLGLTR
ncbi:MAG TPA: metalloregulator ArsR/SmtB family transcription factor [Acidimicrobiia bacterium]|nr:metalloregulator ArsR/SmtB family transcription factor [Acidimicrobiia bacterium]